VEIRQLEKHTSIVEDCKTRDFTVNGLYFGPSEHEVFDLVGGIEHVEKNILSCIESPELTFSKDFRRYIRAIRFQVEKGYTLDEGIQSRIQQHSHSDMHYYKKIFEFAPEFEKILLADDFFVQSLCELIKRGMVLHLQTLKQETPKLVQLGKLCSSSQRQTEWQHTA
jgi:tRNA nucleotidyltransferase/poly(A) polymerase